MAADPVTAIRAARDRIQHAIYTHRGASTATRIAVDAALADITRELCVVQTLLGAKDKTDGR